MLRTTTTTIEWHDIRDDPEDLPGAGEPIIVTLESVNGDRMVWLDVYLKELEDDRTIFVTKSVNEYGLPEETAVWYPVICWAYPPDPFSYY